MSPISVTGSSSSNGAAAYQEYLATLQAQKQAAAKEGGTKPTSKTTPAQAGDVDHDGDSH